MANNDIKWYETDLTDSKEDRNKPYVKIKDGVTELPGYCFAHCNNLTEINIPNSVEKIGWDCFKGCTNLKTLIIPEHLGYSRDYLGIPDDCELIEY